MNTAINKITIKLTPITMPSDGLGREQQFISFEHYSESELGVIATKIGFVRVNPAKAEALLAMINNGEVKWKFADRPMNSGLYEVALYHH